MAKIDTIIFDLDGTLLNTLEDLTDSVNYMLNKYDFENKTIAQIRTYVGNGIKKLIERALSGHNISGEKFDECLSVFEQHYSQNMANKTAPYDGILEMLEQINKCGYKSAIVSNKYDEAVQDLKVNMFKGLINVAIGEREGIPAKPAPDGVFDALKLLSSDKQTAVYVGDSDVDVLTAKNAGLECIAVSWGFKDKDFLSSLGVKHIADTPAQLIDIIKSL